MINQLTNIADITETGIIELPTKGYIINGVYYYPNFATYPIFANKFAINNISCSTNTSFHKVINYMASFGTKGVIANTSNYTVASSCTTTYSWNVKTMNYMTSVANPNKLDKVGMFVSNGEDFIFSFTKPYGSFKLTQNGYIDYYDGNNIVLGYTDNQLRTYLITTDVRQTDDYSSLYFFSRPNYFTNIPSANAIFSLGGQHHDYLKYQILNDRNDYIYYYAGSEWQFTIGAVDKISHTSTTLLSGGAYNNYDARASGVLSNFYEDDITTLDTNTCYHAYNNNGTLTIKRYTIDYKNISLKADDVVVDNPYFFPTTRNDNIMCIPFIHTYKGVKYLSIITSSVRSAISFQHKIITYLIDTSDTTNLYQIGVFDVLGSISSIYGIDFIDKDNNLLAVAKQRIIEFVYFNGNSWIKSEVNLAGAFRTYVRDSMNRIFVIDDAKRLFMLSFDTPYKLEIKAEKDYYEYNGVNILTYVNINAYDFLGNRMAVVGKLRIISDNAIFPNGTKELTVSTSTGGSVKVNILITNSGLLDVVFDLIQ